MEYRGSTPFSAALVLVSVVTGSVSQGTHAYGAGQLPGVS